MRIVSIFAVSLLAALLLCGPYARAYTVVQVTNDAYLNYMPSLIERAEGGLMIVYERLDSNYEHGDLMVTFSDDGMVWSTPAPIVATAANERHPALVQLDDGMYQVYYLSDASGGYKIYHATSDDGTTWTLQGVVDLGWSNEQLVNPTVCVEDDGSLTMAYDWLSSGGYVAHSVDGLVWDHDRTNVSDGSLNRIMRHSNGTYVVSYQKRTGVWYYQIDIFTKTSTDRINWSGETRVTTNQNSHDSFSVELVDGQFALYYAKSVGGQPYDLYSRVSHDGASWVSEENWLPYTGWDTEPHPITLPTGVIAMSWPRGVTQTTMQVFFALLDPATSVEPDEEELDRVTLSASPNPFRGVTHVSYSLARAPATLAVYDVRGRLVVSLGEQYGSGSLTWNGTDSAGAPVPAGVYFLRLESAEQAKTAKVVVMR